MSKITKNRILAYIIDSLFISFISVLIINIVGINETIKLYKFNSFNQEWFINFSLNYILFLFYFLFFDILYNGVSIGKNLFDLKIILENNSIKTFLIRTFLKSLFLYSPLILILFIYYIKQKSILYDDYLKVNVK